MRNSVPTHFNAAGDINYTPLRIVIPLLPKIYGSTGGIADPLEFPVPVERKNITVGRQWRRNSIPQIHMAQIRSRLHAMTGIDRRILPIVLTVLRSENTKRT
jgi:hypothetical protein